MSTKLLEEILSEENLSKASKAVKSNKGTCGVDGMKVGELDAFIHAHGKEICNKLVRETSTCTGKCYKDKSMQTE